MSPSEKPAPAIVNCKKTMRDPVTGISKPCPGFMKGGECVVHKKIRNHLNPYVSGFCGGKNQCEGMRPKSPTGKPMKTCHLWLTCPCDCHEFISMAFAKAGRERVTMDNPEYIVDHSHFILPTAAEVAAEKAASTINPVTIIKSDDERLPDTVVRKFTASPTGRAAKGELELYVKQCCDEYFTAPNRRELTCDVKHVQQWIKSRDLTAKEPSAGAVDAVFKRWDRLGFALIGKKPTRFVMYSDEGRSLGLEGLKAKEKREKNRPQTLRS